MYLKKTLFLLTQSLMVQLETEASRTFKWVFGSGIMFVALLALIFGLYNDAKYGSDATEDIIVEDGDDAEEIRRK